jgi:23S rRNA (guanosine2251-2'-O)-methyltransferase
MVVSRPLSTIHPEARNPVSRRPKSPPQGRAEQPRASGRTRPSPAPPGRIWLYGQHAVAAALANPDRPCYRVLATEATLAGIEPAARARAITPEKVPPERIAQLLPAETPHQGLAAAVGPLPDRDPEELGVEPDARSLILALDQVNDPRNLGAILRTAAALGVDGVILPDRRSAELAGACAKAASGALDLVPLVEVVNLGRALAGLKERGYWVVGLDAAGTAALETLDLPQRIVLVLGSEGEGLRRLVAEQCDHLAHLRIDPRMESLNVSVAAGIALYLLARAAS